VAEALGQVWNLATLVPTADGPEMVHSRRGAALGPGGSTFALGGDADTGASAKAQDGVQEGRARQALGAPERKSAWARLLPGDLRPSSGTGSSATPPHTFGEAEATSIRYVAELIGDDTDTERVIRWLIALIVLCCDPWHCNDGRGVGKAVRAREPTGRMCQRG